MVKQSCSNLIIGMVEIASKEDLLFKPNKELDEIQQEGEDNIYVSAKNLMN